MTTLTCQCGGRPDRYERYSNRCPLHGRRYVSCDEECGALEHPQTLDEHKITLEHYKNHSLDSGCSHGA